MENTYPGRGGPTAGRYQLRHAAGLYWLIDMEQPGGTYISPVPLNDTGARLWRMLESGASPAEICRRLCAEYEIPVEQARGDVRDFIELLQTMHVDLGGNLNERTYDRRSELSDEPAHQKDKKRGT